jgi:putative SOS response-associated peptidase YedK
VCGRATLSSPAQDIATLFDVEPIDIGPARFNIAPTQPILTVRARRSAAGETGDLEPSTPHDPHAGTPVARELSLVRWGLIPWWAKPDEAKKIASRCIQARAETAPRTPAFRDAFRRHRCLVVVDGFFEWKTLPDGRRIPHLVRHGHGKGAPFAIAGLWDRWRPRKADGPPDKETTPQSSLEHEGERIESCAVLTTRAGGSIRDLHGRMPLVLPREHWDTWLVGNAEEAARLLEPEQATLDARADELVVIPVSTWVNDVRHDDPRCIEPAPIVSAVAGPTTTAEQIDFGFTKPAAAAAAGARSRARKH